MTNLNLKLNFNLIYAFKTKNELMNTETYMVLGCIMINKSIKTTDMLYLIKPD